LGSTPDVRASQSTCAGRHRSRLASSFALPAQSGHALDRLRGRLVVLENLIRPVADCDRQREFGRADRERGREPGCTRDADADDRPAPERMPDAVDTSLDAVLEPAERIGPERRRRFVRLPVQRGFALAGLISVAARIVVLASSARGQLDHRIARTIEPHRAESLVL
jgi:hypothetical protein